MTNKAPKVEETMFPIAMFKNSMPFIPEAPAKLTITKETAAIKNLLTSPGETLINPTTSPKTTRTAKIIPLTCPICPRLALKTPRDNANTTPIKKAHAPNKLSLDLITL